MCVIAYKYIVQSKIQGDNISKKVRKVLFIVKKSHVKSYKGGISGKGELGSDMRVR